MPAFLCVTTVGFKESLKGSREACDALAELQALSRGMETEVTAARLKRQTSGGPEPYDHQRKLFEVAARLREIVEALPLPDRVAKGVAALYSSMGDNLS